MNTVNVTYTKDAPAPSVGAIAGAASGGSLSPAQEPGARKVMLKKREDQLAFIAASARSMQGPRRGSVDSIAARAVNAAAAVTAAAAAAKEASVLGVPTIGEIAAQSPVPSTFMPLFSSPDAKAPAEPKKSFLDLKAKWMAQAKGSMNLHLNMDLAKKKAAAVAIPTVSNKSAEEELADSLMTLDPTQGGTRSKYAIRFKNTGCRRVRCLRWGCPPCSKIRCTNKRRLAKDRRVGGSACQNICRMCHSKNEKERCKKRKGLAAEKRKAEARAEGASPNGLALLEEVAMSSSDADAASDGSSGSPKVCVKLPSTDGADIDDEKNLPPVRRSKKKRLLAVQAAASTGGDATYGFILSEWERRMGSAERSVAPKPTSTESSEQADDSHKDLISAALSLSSGANTLKAKAAVDERDADLRKRKERHEDKGRHGIKKRAMASQYLLNI